MRAIYMLRREHELILSAIDVLDEFVQRMARGRAVPAVYAAELASVLHFFGERCHQGNEEQALFPALEAHGIRRLGGPIGAMLAEHERARKHLWEMIESSSHVERAPEARARFVSAARAYSTLMRAHLSREEDGVFAIAEAMLDPKEDERLVRSFQHRQHELLGPGEYARLQARLHGLTQRWAA